MAHVYNSDCSDSDDIPEVSFTLCIHPYMYEPETSNNDDHIDSDSSDCSEELHIRGDEDDVDSMASDQPVGEWCSCNMCSHMSTEDERKCCQDMSILEEKLTDIGCITQHEGFIANCLNMHVLETSYYEYAETHGPGRQEDIHRKYRLVAYRRFIRWTWKVLGKKNRQVIPSCAVTAIRKQFPSQQYTGFKYPRF
ncbi:P2X purinoceptor 7-like [Ylistrum balloti]|uniref:P2X purinoceptor 7-like n=1 Tax=Ylistrum balloti TaxID=509963 RepID=UPI002905CFF0|nr:P2X purinoceptor 7-like [Ylistrum balloti]